ncbi:MAG: succinylglutamate desuccinylase/aspartoacylase family protein [Nitrospinae bacterium]|nr:succinylglutamate desuccinylase/aspartoacylase family protein [Nitrospinota bacterium]
MKTHKIASRKNPLGGSIEIIKQTFSSIRSKPVKRISFVAGLHGDELEGVYLCHRIIETLRQLKATRPQAFQGEVHVYPAVNPQALSSATRLWPFFSMDMNRKMGEKNGDSLPSGFARSLVEDLQASSDIVVDFHASNLHLKELPQIRIIEEFDKKLIPLAALCNMDVVWVHPSAPVFESTLGYNLNRKKIAALVVETGICLRIHQEFCEQVFQGMIHLLRQTGVLDLADPPPKIKQPLLIHPKQVALIQANHAGLFISNVPLGAHVKKGDLLGKVVDAVRGEVLETIASPADGLLFTLREQPVTYQGAPLARIALQEIP